MKICFDVLNCFFHAGRLQILRCPGMDGPFIMDKG